MGTLERSLRPTGRDFDPPRLPYDTPRSQPSTSPAVSAGYSCSSSTAGLSSTDSLAACRSMYSFAARSIACTFATPARMIGSTSFHCLSLNRRLVTFSQCGVFKGSGSGCRLLSGSGLLCAGVEEAATSEPS